MNTDLKKSKDAHPVSPPSTGSWNCPRYLRFVGRFRSLDSNRSTPVDHATDRRTLQRGVPCLVSGWFDRRILCRSRQFYRALCGDTWVICERARCWLSNRWSRRHMLRQSHQSTLTKPVTTFEADAQQAHWQKTNRAESSRRRGAVPIAESSRSVPKRHKGLLTVETMR